MDLALDVQCKKLTEWLVLRNVIDAKWQLDIAPIREKIEDGILRLPDQEVAELNEIVREPTIHYFHCRQILSILESRLGDAAKGWLGNYKDKQLQEWAAILKSYKKKNINTGEAARILERNTIYEIPSIKSQLVRNDKETTDLLKKVKSNEKAIVTQTKLFEQSCKALGIEGRDLRTELRNLTAQKIPKKLNQVLKIVHDDDLQKAIEYRKAFIKYTLDTVNSNETMTTDKQFNVQGYVLKAIKLLREEATELDEINVDKPEERDEVTIDWDMDMEMDASGFEISGGEENTEPVVIDWNDNDKAETGAEIEINWDLDVDADAGENADVGLNIQNEEKDDNDIGIWEAKNSNRDVSLLDKDTRNMLLNDAVELNGFLSQRIAEMKSSSHLNEQLRLDADEGVKTTTLETVESFFQISQSLLDTLMAEDLQNLLMIKQNGASLDRLVHSLEQQRSSVDKFRQSINQLEAKCSQIKQISVELRKKLKIYRKSTQELKENLEKVLSKHFNGREVHIVGEVNFL